VRWGLLFENLYVCTSHSCCFAEVQTEQFKSFVFNVSVCRTCYFEKFGHEAHWMCSLLRVRLLPGYKTGNVFQNFHEKWS
jgi:hypothetical protein